MKIFTVLLLLMITIYPSHADIEDQVKHGYVEHGDIKLHYAELGEGPLVVMMHGFPDFWYTWRHQMQALAEDFHVVAFDLRGYNKSSKPKGQENYDTRFLVNDLAAVINHFGKEKAIIVGHNWGGFIAWNFAMQHPEMTEKLIVLNLPHPKGFMRELANNPQQQKNSQYARDFQQADAHEHLSPEILAGFITKDEEIKKRYIEAYQLSDIEAMLNYYKQNFPKKPYKEFSEPLIKVQAPVLLIHGVADKAIMHHGLNGTWEWVDSDLTIVTVPGAGHWVHHDAEDLVSKTMKSWLLR